MVDVIILKQKVDVEALVSSDSVPGAFYRVEFGTAQDGDTQWQCSCPDFEKRGDKRACKHIQPVRNKAGV